MKERRRYPRAEDPRAGFTLIEVMAALVILGLAIAMGATSFARREARPTPVETAETLQKMLLAARSEAIVTGGDRAVIVDPQKRVLLYPADAAPVDIGAGLDIRIQTGQEFVAGESQAHIVFRGDGSSSGARVTFSDGVRADGEVEVHWLTGIPKLTRVARP